MKNNLLPITFILFASLSVNAQVQIGSDLIGYTNGISFGSSVSISSSGNRIAVGAESFLNAESDLVGYVKVLEWVNEDWVQVGDDIEGTEDWDFLGHAVSLSDDGNTIAISGIANTNAAVPGKVKVFEWSGSAWMQKGNDILGAAVGDHFGFSISLSSDGTRVVSGAIYNDGNGEDSGQVRVHAFVDGDWVQLGEDIKGEQAGDFLGGSVDISSDGNRIAAGAVFGDGSAMQTGYVKVFEWMDDTWVQMGNKISGEQMFDLFGTDLSFSANGSRIAVGAINNNGNEVFVGHVRVLEWENGDWQQVGLDIDGEALGTHFGGSVALSDDGNRLVVGAPLNDAAHDNAGQVRIFDWLNDTWGASGMRINGDRINAQIGMDIAVSGNGERLIVSARNFVIGGQEEGMARVYDISELTDIVPVLDSPSLTIYPNPCKNELFLNTELVDEIQIVDLRGSTVKTISKPQASKIDVSTLDAGIYFFKVRIGESLSVSKVIKS